MRKHLLTGEELVYRANLHWIVFLKPAFFLSVALFFLAFGNLLFPDIVVSNLSDSIASFGYYGLDSVRWAGVAILVLFAMPTALSPMIRKMTSEFWVSNKREFVEFRRQVQEQIDTL